MSKMIVTAVGVRGSGKSNAYGAMIELLKVQQRDSYYLTACGATPEERLRNSGIIDRYADISKGFIKAGTMVTTDFPFAFGGHFRPDIPNYPLLDMPLVDYSGGLLQTMQQEGSEDATRLLHRIMDTDVLLLFADANILSEGGEPYNPEPARRRIAKEINTIFEILGTERDAAFVSKPRSVILMLTKCDSTLIPKELRADHFHGLANRALRVFDSTMRFCINQPGWKLAIVPTSTCGDGNSRTWRNADGAYQSEMIAPPEPYGFDTGLLYGVMCELESRVRLGIDGDDAPPDEIERKSGFVSAFQWRHILSRLADQESEQTQLYRRYVGNLHSILDPLKGIEYFEI